MATQSLFSSTSKMPPPPSPDFQSIQANYYLSAFPHPLASPAWAATTTQQASDAIANTQRQWNAYAERLAATPWMRAQEKYTRLGALVGLPNAGQLLHQGALPIGMRTELAKTLKLEAPAPPRQAPAKPDTDTPANEEAETVADATEGEPES